MASDTFHLMDFEELERRFHNFVEKHARTWAIPGHGSDDVRQEILITLFECQRGYDPERGVPFFAYFKRATINKLVKVNGVARRRGAADSPVPLEAADRPGAGPDPSELAGSADFVRRLAELSAGAREYARYKLGLGPRPADASVTAARRELRDRLGEELADWRDTLRLPVAGDDGRTARWARRQEA